MEDGGGGKMWPHRTPRHQGTHHARQTSNRAPLQLLQPRRAVLITVFAGPIELLLIWGLLCGQLRQAPPPPAGWAQGPRVLTSSQPQLKRARQGCCCTNELCGLLGSAPGGAGRGWGGGWSWPWKGDLGPFPGRGSKDTLPPPHLAHLAGWANRMSFLPLPKRKARLGEALGTALGNQGAPTAG